MRPCILMCSGSTIKSTITYCRHSLQDTWRWKQHIPPKRLYPPTRLYRVFRAQADWALTHTSHKDTEQSTIEASITLDGVTLTHWSGDHRMNDLQFVGRYHCLSIRYSGRLISLHNEHSMYIYIHTYIFVCARNRTQDLWICSQELRPLDHRGGQSPLHVTL
jgi:hypothetical protein